MKVVVFGATGLIGHGVVQECLTDPGVREVVVVGRTPLDQRHPKLRGVVHADLLDLTPVAGDLAGVDACFWTIGVSAVGLDPQEYERVTYGYTTAAAQVLAAVNPDLTFVYVSGAGTDSTERGRSRWARVKGRTENAILATFPNGYALRPAFVRGVHGQRSRTAMYRWIATVLTPVAPLMHRWWPSGVTSTAEIGRAMLRVARDGHPRRILENRDIVAAAGRS